MHVDDYFVVRPMSRCDVFRDELNVMVPVESFGELIPGMIYRDCRYTRERERGTPMISQKTFADE